MKCILFGGSGEVGGAVARGLAKSDVCSRLTLLGRRPVVAMQHKEKVEQIVVDTNATDFEPSGVVCSRKAPSIRTGSRSRCWLRSRPPRRRARWPRAHGTTSLMLSPTQLIDKLVALVPPPRRNLIRYHGVLAPAAADRAQIVPGPSSLTEASVSCSCDQATPEASQRRHRAEWARPLARVLQNVMPAAAKGSLPQANSEETGRQAGLRYRRALRPQRHPQVPRPRRYAVPLPAHFSRPSASPRIRRGCVRSGPGRARRCLEPIPACP